MFQTQTIDCVSYSAIPSTVGVVSPVDAYSVSDSTSSWMETVENGCHQATLFCAVIAHEAITFVACASHTAIAFTSNTLQTVAATVAAGYKYSSKAIGDVYKATSKYVKGAYCTAESSAYKAYAVTAFYTIYAVASTVEFVCATYRFYAARPVLTVGLLLLGAIVAF